MFINVVQKAQPLFQAFPQVQDKAASKALGLANPLFSWHANYLTNQRKKIVVLTHDASSLTVILADVNAKNRHQLEDRFWQQLDHLWQQSGLSAADFVTYREKALAWQINQTISRSQVGHNTEQISSLKWALADRPVHFDEVAAAEHFTAGFHRLSAKQVVSATDLPQIMTPTNYEWHQPATRTIVNSSQLQKYWTRLAALEQASLHVIDTADDTQLTAHVQKIQRLNQQLINTFIVSIQADYAAKTITGYRSALEFYLNEYLAYHFTTLTNLDATNIGELYLHGVSETEIKRIRRSITKLYQFLQQNGVITATQLKDFKENLKSSLDNILASLDIYADYFDE